MSLFTLAAIGVLIFFNSVANVAMITSVGAIIGAVVTGWFGLLSAKRPDFKPTAIDVAQSMLIEQIKWLDGEIVRLRQENRDLETINRQLLRQIES